MSPELLRLATGSTRAGAQQLCGPLAEGMAAYGIDTPTRRAEFLAQIGHESGSLRYLSEIWGPTDAQRRYEGRKDLGNTQPGDGSRYRGRALIQTTGRANYCATRDGLRLLYPTAPDFEADPLALCDVKWAALSACWYWHSRGCNELADAGDFLRICQRINGGAYGRPNGLDDRRARRVRCLALFGVAA